MMDKTKADQLIKKYLNGLCSPEESLLIEDWYLSALDEKGPLARRPDLSAIKEKLNARLNGLPQRKKPWLIYMIRIAAVLLLAGGMVFYFLPKLTDFQNEQVTGNSGTIRPGTSKAVLKLADGRVIHLNNGQHGIIVVNDDIKYADGTPLVKNGSKTTSITSNTISTPRGGQYQVVLPDGTKVRLNAASSLRYPAVFNKMERMVELEGEAYFEVAKNNGQKTASPFVVKSRGNKVVVLGTAFNVNSYDQTVTTTLINGSVKVSNMHGEKLLMPGQQAMMGAEIHVMEADMNKAIAWVTGEFYFKRDNIRLIMQQLARWYDLEIQYKGDIDDTKEYSGNIKRDVDLPEVLEMITYLSGASFEVDGHKVTVNVRKKNNQSR